MWAAPVALACCPMATLALLLLPLPLAEVPMATLFPVSPLAFAPLPLARLALLFPVALALAPLATLKLPAPLAFALDPKIGIAHVCTPVTLASPMPASAFHITLAFEIRPVVAL